MSEEELKAIKHLKNYKYDNEVRQSIDIILNLIEKQQEKLKKYKFNMGVICEYSIDVSKGHINAKDAIEGIRKYIYWGQ